MGRRKRKHRSAGSICNMAGTGLIIIMIALCSLLVLPGIFGYQMYNVITGSMEPSIPVGSLIYVNVMGPEEIREKDVIAFYSSVEDGSIITHRVVMNNVVLGTFNTKGDANDGDDPVPVEYANFIGKVELTIPYMGKVLTVMSSLYGKIAGVCIILAGALLSIMGTRQDDREE